MPQCDHVTKKYPNIIFIIIIFYFKNAAFFHAKPGDSRDTLQDLTQPLVENSPSVSYPPMGVGHCWSEFLVAGCSSTPTSSDQGRDTGICMDTSSAVVEFLPRYQANNKINIVCLMLSQSYSWWSWVDTLMLLIVLVMHSITGTQTFMDTLNMGYDMYDTELGQGVDQFDLLQCVGISWHELIEFLVSFMTHLKSSSYHHIFHFTFSHFISSFVCHMHVVVWMRKN